MSKTTLGVLGELSLIAQMAPDRETAVARVKKAMNALIGKLDHVVALATIIPLLRSKYLLEELEVRNETWLLLENTQKKFCEEGRMGMLIHNTQIYPVDLDIVEDFEWTMEKEIEILEKLGEQFLIENKLGSFEGEIMLFGERGFSGELKHVTSRRKDDSRSASLAALFKPRNKVTSRKPKK